MSSVNSCRSFVFFNMDADNENNNTQKIDTLELGMPWCIISIIIWDHEALNLVHHNKEQYLHEIY